MACFAGNIELPAQHRHFLAFQQPGHESESFVHLGTLLPRHLRLPQMPESVTYVSGMICNLCVRKDIRSIPDRWVTVYTGGMICNLCVRKDIRYLHNYD